MSDNFAWPNFSAEPYTKMLLDWIKSMPSMGDGFFDTFIDVGPGVKNSESYIVKEYFPDCKIMGFEPHPKRYSNLKSSYPGELHNTAISSNTGILHGFIDDDNDPHKQFYTSDIMGSMKNFDMKCTSIDDIIESDSQIKKAIVWADIEGGEFDMLKGCAKSIMHGKIAGINLEINFSNKDELPPGWPLWWEIIHFMRVMGFAPFASSTPGVTSYNSKVYKDLHCLNGYHLNSHNNNPHADFFFMSNIITNELDSSYFTVYRD